MTRTSQHEFQPDVSLDPIVCRQRAAEIRSRELALLAGSLLRALRQLAAQSRGRAVSSAEADAGS